MIYLNDRVHNRKDRIIKYRAMSDLQWVQAWTGQAVEFSMLLTILG